MTIMTNLVNLINNGTITIEELAQAPQLIERAQLVIKGLEACKKTIKFNLGVTNVSCYSYTDRAGEYSSWGDCTVDGVFTCYCNWGGNHQIGQVNLLDSAAVFAAFNNSEFSHDLERFLKEQIEAATKK